MRVAEAMKRDIGKRRARMGPDAMDFLGASPGDIVKITGMRSSCAIVWPADEDETTPGIIRIDGQTRTNMSVSINDTVSVVKTQVKTARSAVLIPVNDSVTIDDEFTNFVKNRLSDIPLMQGDEISVKILGNSMMFRIGKTIPNSVIRIADSTSLVISDEPPVNQRARITYEEVGGLTQEIDAMREIVELPLRHPELFTRLGVEAHSGVLLYGPPGCGKTLIAKVLASESDANMFSISGPEIVNKYYGETEARLREIFQEAKENAPSIIFIDEIDAIAPKRDDAYGDVEKRVVAQLLALMDGLDERGNVIVLGATNRPDSMEAALRRPGRFDREFEISVPNVDGRLDILQIHTRGMPLSQEINLKDLAGQLYGYTGADIKSLCREAATRAIRRYLPQMDLESERIPTKVLKTMEIKLVDFYLGMHEVVPTAMREFYVERPKVFWKDVGGMDDVKTTLTENLLVSIKNPSKFSNMGIRPPKGVLLYGPPGCGKTLVSRALAAESGANMILVRGPEILSKWLGESEKAVREIFRKAKASSPCAVIFDELDSLAKVREGSAGETVLSQLLTEIEGTTPGVVVIGITNRPDVLDASLLRTGRLDMSIYVGPPDEANRLDIIKILTSKMPLDSSVNIGEIAVATSNYTGADLAALCRETAIRAMRHDQSAIHDVDFAEALKVIRPSITQDIQDWYENVGQNISKTIPKKTDKVFYG